MHRYGLMALTCTLIAGCMGNHRAEIDARQTAIAALLDDKPGWSLLNKEQNTSPFLTEMLEYDPEYEPYFLTGFFSQDSREEFVAAIENGDRQEVYLFINHDTSYEAHRFAELTWLRDAGLFRRDRQVGIGDFFSDNVTWFEWNEATGQMEAVEEHRDE